MPTCQRPGCPNYADDWITNRSFCSLECQNMVMGHFDGAAIIPYRKNGKDISILLGAAEQGQLNTVLGGSKFHEDPRTKEIIVDDTVYLTAAREFIEEAGTDIDTAKLITYLKKVPLVVNIAHEQVKFGRYENGKYYVLFMVPMPALDIAKMRTAYEHRLLAHNADPITTSPAVIEVGEFTWFDLSADGSLKGDIPASFGDRTTQRSQMSYQVISREPDTTADIQAFEWNGKYLDK